ADRTLVRRVKRPNGRSARWRAEEERCLSSWSQASSPRTGGRPRCSLRRSRHPGHRALRSHTPRTKPGRPAPLPARHSAHRRRTAVARQEVGRPAGAGVGAYETNNSAPDTKAGATWNARVTVGGGKDSIMAVEGAYVGTTAHPENMGSNNNTNVLSNGID